jgi:hypothetical protein
MPDDEHKLNRRLFLQHSAMATAASATWYSVAMKTDAVAQAQDQMPHRLLSFPPGPPPYAYDEEPL